MTLAKVIKYATLIESSEARASEIEIKEETINKMKISNDDEHLFQLFKQKQLQQNTKQNNGNKCYGCGNVGHYFKSAECPAKDKRCNYCKRPNHFESVCFKKTKEKNEASIKRIEHNSSDSDEYLFKLTDNNIVDVEVKVDNYPITFLIDSGASINLIDKTTFDKLLDNCDVKLNSTSAKVYTYGSKIPLPLKGVFYSNISLGYKHDIV